MRLALQERRNLQQDSQTASFHPFFESLAYRSGPNEGLILIKVGTPQNIEDDLFNAFKIWIQEAAEKPCSCTDKV